MILTKSDDAVQAFGHPGMSRQGASHRKSITNRPAYLATLLLFAACYVMVVGYFAQVDVYHDHFFDPAYSRSYNFFRIVFCAYLFWIVYFSGRCVLLVFSKATEELSGVQQIALGFFVGAAVWTLAMLALGYAGLYSRMTALLVTVIVIAASSRHLLDVGRAAIATLPNVRLRDGPSIAMTAIACAFAALLMMIKGLYPAGGADYFVHYFHYYVKVLENGHIWPNELWYHYYYSKGMGLFFLGMLLTDPLGASLATFCFAGAVAVALFAFVDRIRAARLWPWVAVILFLGFYIYTPGKGTYFLNGGWGDFQKPHEISAAFLLALLWISASFVVSTDEMRRLWWLAGALCAFTLAFITAFSAIVAGMFFGLMAAICIMVGRRQSALGLLGLGAVAGAGLIAILALNYLTTGLPLDNGLGLFWPIIDVRRLREWGVLPDVVLTMAGRLVFAQSALPLSSVEMRDFLKNVFRVDVLFPLIAVTAAAGLATRLYAGARAVSIRSGRSAPQSFSAPGMIVPTYWAFGAALALMASTLCAAVLVGRTQPISFVRYTSFILPVMAALIALGWQTMARMLPRTRRIHRGLHVILPFLILGVAIATTNPSYRDTARTLIGTSARFAAGSASIYDAFVDQRGWPGRSEDAAVRPWALAVWKELGPGTRFWTFTAHTYCMVPGCRPEIFGPFRLSPRALDILLGTAAQAQAILHEERLDHFLVEMDDDLRDFLLCAPLFAPDRIQDHLGTRWTDGTHFLLTWLGPGIEPLTPAWLEQYRRKIGGVPCSDMPLLQNLAEQLGNNPRWGADLVMPWSRR